MKKSKEHARSQKPGPDKSSTNAERQGFDRDTAQRQQRDHMVTDTNATQSSEATGGALQVSRGRDPRSQNTPDQRSTEAGRRSSVESPEEPQPSEADRHTGSGRDTMTGGRGQG